MCTGCSTGEVIILSSGDSCIEVDGNIAYGHYDDDVGMELARIKWRPHSVTALASTKKRIAVGDSRGNITLGSIAGISLTKQWEIESHGYVNYSASELRVWRNMDRFDHI